MVLFDPIEAKHNQTQHGFVKKNYGSSSQHLMVENETVAINVGHPIHGLHILGQTLEVDWSAKTSTLVV